MHKYIGIDIGGTFIKGVLIDDHRLLAKTTMHTKVGDPQWQSSVDEIFQQLFRDSEQPIEGVGLSAPGVADPENKKIICMPGRLPGLEGYDWSRLLKRKVTVLNDAHAALVAESCWGVVRGLKNVVMLTLGTGIGGGILINGKLHQGFLQRAGHLGHISIDASLEAPDITGISGSLEDAVGEATLSKRSLGKFTTTEELVTAYKSGDTWATYVWLQAVRKLALGLVSTINSLSPELIVLAGGITQAKELLLTPLHAFLDLYEWRIGGQATPVKLAKYGEFSGALGAALFARSITTDKQT